MNATTEEQIILGLAIHGECPRGALETLQSVHFTGKRALVWSHIEDLNARGVLTQNTLYASLMEDRANVGELNHWLSLPKLDVDLAPVIGKLEDAHARRELQASLKAASDAVAGGRPLDGVMSLLEYAVARGVPKATQESEWMDGGAVMAAGVEAVMARCDAYRSGSPLGVTTGYPALDARLGPMQPDPYIIMARPGVGKTALALGILEHNCLEGKRVAVFSMEMAAAQIAMRLLSSKKVPGRGMVKGDLTRSQLEAMFVAQEEMETWDWSLNPRPALRVRELAMAVEENVRRYGRPDLIIIDHVHLMKWDARLSTNDGMAEISAGIKAITKQHGIPALCLAQLNRAVESRQDGRPKMSDLRGSGAWEQDATGIIGLHRPHAGNADAPPDEQAKSVAIVLKNRYGEAGDAPLVWNPNGGGYVLGA